jgi:hypothetical protein
MAEVLSVFPAGEPLDVRPVQVPGVLKEREQDG